MALIKCKECGNQISSDASACPNCGKPVKKTSPAASGCLVVIIVIVVIAVVGQCSGNSSTESKPAPAVAVNLNDAKALDEKYDTAAVVHCASEADDYLRAASKFSFKWDDMGAFEAKFDRFRTQVSAPGVLTMVSSKASLQNGFGAYQRIELLCEYDTQNNKVLSYSIRER
jgi:zinc-ribbon domain